MENGKRKVENDGGAFDRADFSGVSRPTIIDEICPACGAENRRETARFCRVCGKLLLEDYQPLDVLRSSYRLQGKSFALPDDETADEENLFEINKNQIAQTAWACFVYSLVPYLGILFVPLTFCVGGVGYAYAVRHPQIGGRKLALQSFYLSFIVLAIQIFLWWLLYFIPTIQGI